MSLAPKFVRTVLRSRLPPESLESDSRLRKLSSQGVLCVVALFAAVEPITAEDKQAPNAIRFSRQVALALVPERVAVSGDGNMIMAASRRVVVAIKTNGKQLQRWEQPKDVIDVCVSQHGKLVAVTTGTHLIDVYETATGKRMLQLHRDDAPDFLRRDGQQRIAFYPDTTKLISSGSKSRAYVSDVKTGKWDHINWTKYTTSTPVVSPNAKHVAFFGLKKDSELSGQVTMYGVRRGLQPLWTKWHKTDDAVTQASFSSDGSRLATCAPDGVRVWDVNSGEPLAHLQDELEARTLGVAFVATNDHLLFASPRRIELRKIGIEESQSSVSIAKESPLKGMSCSTDGSIAVTYGIGTAVDVWSVRKP